VAPSVFGPGGLYGGGERYPLELAEALAGEVDCELVTFGRRPGRWRTDRGMRVRVLRPLTWLHGHPAKPVALLLPAALTQAEVVHAHNFRSVPTRMSAVTARILGAGTVVTDHGLLGRTWGGLVHGLFDRFLTVSQFAARMLGAPPARTQVIYGGADTRRFAPAPGADRDGVLFVGRLTRIKGSTGWSAPYPPASRSRSRAAPATIPVPPSETIPRCFAGSPRARKSPSSVQCRILPPCQPVPPSRGSGPPFRRPYLLRPGRPRVRVARPGSP
jgi:hypothetical protein